MTGADPWLTTHQRSFVVKAICKTENNSETCRLFEREFERAVNRDTVVDIIVPQRISSVPAKEH